MVCESMKCAFLLLLVDTSPQAIPWLCATTMGLAALALETNPVWPTYPNRMPDADVTAGLVLPKLASRNFVVGPLVVASWRLV